MQLMLWHQICVSHLIHLIWLKIVSYNQPETPRCHELHLTISQVTLKDGPSKPKHDTLNKVFCIYSSELVNDVKTTAV